ncbi:twin-arginine translocation pathway signal protein [Roseomonas terrae]|uniref:Twin-arginine translocation pathway signal protein n=1 Tax=Neoroseomonas terrae TaxID=424799 RepID=A0ABS5EIJ5_9PROT|nr:tripartite tricarboxylate transporter substrate-binding protein [Neoroseomonas terrae]MBR0650854.1 twin-arginine translocation pathway signal protein [Neoroseomonas terrae]
MFRIARRRMLTGTLAMLATPALAEAWKPSRPIRLIVPYGPGGGADTTARLLERPMSRILGQPIVVENRAGGGSTIGTGEAARAAPDGHTLVISATPYLVARFIVPDMPYDDATLVPVSRVIVLPQILLLPQELGVANLPALVEHLRQQNGAASYGTSGMATASHLAMLDLLKRAGVEAIHAPYRGIGPALQDLLGNRLTMVIATVASGAPLARDGKARAVGMTSASRIGVLPDIPTIAEQGFPGFERDEWNGVMLPPRTPAAIAERYHEAIREALADGDVRARLEAMGAVAEGSSPRDFAAFLAGQRQSIPALIGEGGIRIE